jgi:hypothetical protein
MWIRIIYIVNYYLYLENYRSEKVYHLQLPVQYLQTFGCCFCPTLRLQLGITASELSRHKSYPSHLK